MTLGGAAVWDAVLAFLEANAMALGAAAAGLTIGGVAWAIVTRPFKRDKPTQLAAETIDQIKPPEVKDGPALSVAEFIRLRRELKADLEQELADAQETEKEELRARIAELESQIANPEDALTEARKRIADLEVLLDREGNHIGADRIQEAKAALEKGDYSLADDIFAEIEARNELAVQETARAAHGRGEVAEAEVRWHDAARHYSNAARLAPGFDTLFKAREYAWRAGELDAAHRYGADLVALARNEGTQEQLATALNEHAITFQAQGRYAQAEALYRQALEIARAIIAEGHPDYAFYLNNLADAVQAQGRYAEAEALYRQALVIARATLGEGDPYHASGLNNLALVVQAQGRYAEAERLFRQALEIGRATLGERHPAYAARLNNLALVVQAQGRYAEAERLYLQALEIDRATIGEGHPAYAARLGNLAHVVQAQRRHDEAEALYRQALEIDRATIGEGHPAYATRLGNLGGLLGQTGRVAEGREMLERALTIFRAALPLDHPHIAETQRRLAALPGD